MFNFVNASHMPSYLNKSYFDDWFDKFNYSLDKIGLPNLNYHKINISIEFSNEKKKKLYGTLTIKELKEYICDVWGNHKEIKDILNRIDSYEDYRKLLQELIGTIYRFYYDMDCHNPEELYSFLDELEFETPVLGEFINNRKLIVLYVPNIEEAANNHTPKNIPAREFEKVFIHEFFHSYHYYNDPEELVERRDYTSKVVKESLASAFEWFYCEGNTINGNDDLWKSWCNYPVLNYPYSGAKNLITSKGGITLRFFLETKKFGNVFDLSLNDMDGALRSLVPEKTFYCIKNQFVCCKSILIRKSTKKLTRTELETLHAGKSVGQIAREEIPPIITAKKNLIPKLLDRGYCKKTFNLDTYTVLALTRIYSTPHYRYYPEATNVDATDYYICSQWYEKQRKNLLDWIWANM